MFGQFYSDVAGCAGDKNCRCFGFRHNYLENVIVNLRNDSERNGEIKAEDDEMLCATFFPKIKPEIERLIRKLFPKLKLILVGTFENLPSRAALLE